MITPADLANLKAIRFVRRDLNAQARSRLKQLEKYIAWIQARKTCFISPDIAKHFGITTSYAMGVLVQLEKLDLVRRAGFRARHGKGSPMVLWEAVA